VADTTDILAIPFPEGADSFSTAIVQSMAERIDEVPGIESLTSAEISALTSAQKPAGRVVYNSTTSKLQVSNGTTFADIDAAALLKAGGTMAGNIAMGGSKVTGLAAASGNGEAVRYEQALLLAGGTMAGAIAMGGSKVTGLAAGDSNGDAVRYEQLTAVDAIADLAIARVAAGSITTTADIHGATLTPPAGMVLSRVVVSVSGTSSFFLSGNGYQQVIVAAEIQTAATGAVNILRHPVGTGSSPSLLSIYVDYVALFV